MAAPEQWTSAAEVAKHLGVATDTVYRWTRREGLPSHRVGRLLKFRLTEVDAWMSRRPNRQEPASGVSRD